MSDWETAIAHWLPQVWTAAPCDGKVWYIPFRTDPGYPWMCFSCMRKFGSEPDDHEKLCPPPSRDLAMRLLDAMRDQGYCVSFDERGSNHMEVYKVGQPDAKNVMVLDTDDTLEMIIKAAASLAR